MKSILLILPAMPDYLPYVETYLQIFRKNQIDYKIVCWNRTDKLYNEDDKTIVFNKPIDNNSSYFHKLRENYMFYRFCKNNINSKDFDMVIVPTMSLGFILSSYLKKSFKDKYIIDIRDCSSIFNNRIVKRVLSSLLTKAKCVVISSKGFERYLPERDYLVVHNTTYDNLSNTSKPKQTLYAEKNVINILTMGLLRLEPNIVMMSQLGNNSKFHLSLAGAGDYASQLEKHIKEKKYQNVDFHGWYDKKDEAGMIEASDFVSIYLTHDQNSDLLMSNRFYLSALHRRPMIVNENTFQAEICMKFDLGVVLTERQSFEEQILNFCKSYNPQKYEEGCNAFLKEVKNDMRIFENTIVGILGIG